jgi:putative cardiolipin synthase
MQITMPGNPAQIEPPLSHGAAPKAGAASHRLRLIGHGILPFLLVLAILGGCASLPPGSNYPKAQSVAFAEPQTTRLGQQFAAESSRNGGRPGFRIFNVGVDGFLIRLEMINAAERSLDLQYYIFRGDETGRLLTDALARAADRGVRVRVLVDDGETVTGDEQLLALSGHPAVEIRVFNPWKYRGHNDLLRGAEFILRHSRLDYRMHNKMLIADSAVALTGGRNIGDQYFQIDPESQFADDDVFVAGPIIRDMSSKFDEYWNSMLAIPAEALTHRDPKDLASSSSRLMAAARARKIAAAGLNYEQKLATGEPLAGILSGKLPLTWADGQFVCDPPDKKSAMSHARVGDLSYQPLAQLATRTQTELIIVSPYFVPTKDELHLLESRSQQQVHVRVLTNSLESAPNPVAHAGYMHYRVKLVQDGVQINEVRARLGNTRGSGESKRLASYGNYALHAKVYIFDRQDLVIGSLNFDVRSRRLNTEMGLIIDNGDLSRQEAGRFDAMTRPENSYLVALRSASGRSRPRLVWRTVEGGKPVEYTSEPARGFWQKVKVTILSWLPIDSEL